MMVSFVLSFFPRDVLDEILNLIESVSEDFPSYSLILNTIYQRKYHLGLAQTGLNSKVVLISSGLNSDILLYLFSYLLKLKPDPKVITLFQCST